jgi:hypothetical protein
MEPTPLAQKQGNKAEIPSKPLLLAMKQWLRFRISPYCSPYPEESTDEVGYSSIGG